MLCGRQDSWDWITNRTSWCQWRNAGWYNSVELVLVPFILPTRHSYLKLSDLAKTMTTREVTKPLLFSNQRLALAYRYFHVPKLARSAEAVSFLPEVADDLVPQRRCAVSEGAAVSLQRHTVRTLLQVTTLGLWTFSMCNIQTALTLVQVE